MNLPRNVYRKGRGFRGVRMVQGRNVRTRVHPTPALAAAELQQLLEQAGEPVPDAAAGGTPAELLAGALEQLAEVTRTTQRALLAMRRPEPDDAP